MNTVQPALKATFILGSPAYKDQQHCIKNVPYSYNLNQYIKVTCL